MINKRKTAIFKLFDLFNALLANRILRLEVLHKAGVAIHDHT